VTGSAGPVRVAVVDDHPVALHGVVHLLAPYPHIVVVHTAASLAELPDLSTVDDSLSTVDGGLPDVYLVDLYLGQDRLSPEQIESLAARRPVLVMSASARQVDVLTAVRAGASGYLPKSSPPQAYAAAIGTAAGGGFYVSPQLADLIESSAPLAGPVATSAALARREREVLGYLAQGFTQRQAATRMGVTAGTVDTYLKRIRQKLGPGNKVTLLSRAQRDGYLTPGTGERV